MLTRGKLIVLEGGEGAGKSTQLRHLQEWLQAHPAIAVLRAQAAISGVVSTREPGGTPLGGDLRQLLLSPEAVAISSTAELLLYAADRADHVETVIQPALNQQQWILCDRYIDSTTAYQGYGRGLDLGLVEQLNQIATGGLQADLTLWLKLDAATGLARTRQRGDADRMEGSDLAFHQRVQTGFETLASHHPERIEVIDASLDQQSVAQQIQQVVEQRLKQWYKPFLMT